MRNLKKLLALVVACVMVFGVVASAAIVNFPDVASNAKYAEAVKVLSALNIINGDDKGNFNPDQNVTRAEMAKILCAMMSKNASFGQTASGFEDVTADHWASGYVKYAKGLNIINGYNDKEFGPEDNVTYEQAIKLIVAALGYTYMADDLGGYPAGYMMVAADLKITDKVAITDSTAPAKRSDIAILAYNAMEVNMMERTSYGTEAKYEPVDKNLLNNKLGIYRVEGYVFNTAKNDASMDEGKIDYSINKINAKTIKALDLTNLGTESAPSYALNDYDCKDDAASDLVFYTSNAYLAENEIGEYEVIAVVAKTTKTKEIVFDDIDVLCDEVTGLEADEYMDVENGVFSYWSNADHDDKRPTTLKVAPVPVMIINNGTPALATTTAILNVFAGNIKVIDTDNDGYYDLFVIKSYDIAVVDSVTASSMTLRLKQNNLSSGVLNTTGVRSIALNEDAVENMKSLTVTINGEAAELTDLAKNDVVLIATNSAYGSSFDPTFVEINAVRNVVEGKVKSGISTEGYIEIGDAEYKVFPGLAAPAISSEGKFYLTSDNTIVYYDTTASISNKYAYAYKVGTSSFGDKSLRMFTAAGEDVTYDVADRIAINGVQTSNKKAATDYTDAEMAEIFGGVASDWTGSEMSPVEIIQAMVDGTLPVGNAAEMKLFAYDVSGTELTKIHLANGSATSESEFGVVPTATQEWVASTNKFKASKTLADGAKVFMIEPTAEFADWKVADAASLVNEKEYAVAFYGYNANGTYNVALISSGLMAADTKAAFAYFKEARTTKYGADEEDAKKVYFIQGGEEKSMFVLDSDSSSATNVAGMAEGDIFIYSVSDKADVMENVDEIAAPVADVTTAMFDGDPYDFDVFEADIIGNPTDDFMYTGNTSGMAAKNEVKAGIIASVESVDGGLKIKLTEDDDVVASDYVYMIPETANVTVLNNKATKNKLYASTLDSIAPSDYVALENGNIDLTPEYETDAKFYYAIVRLYNDVVVDVYVINYANDMQKFTK